MNPNQTQPDEPAVTYEPDPDALLDAFYADCDAGHRCPRCWGKIDATKVTALGIELFQCPNCKSYWIVP
jgi:hypothetical protein